MQIQLSDHFTMDRLLRFTLPTIAMMVFTSVYIVVDGFFCFQLYGQDGLCRRQSYHALSPPFIDGRLHVRHGRQRARREDLGRRG